MAGGQANELFRSLKSRGWYLKDVNIVEQVLEEMEEQTEAEMEMLVEAKLLDMDLKAIGDKCLPDSSAIHRVSHLQGPKVLQVVASRNILESSDRAIVPNQQPHGRLLRICLTDGHLNVTAIEYRPFPLIPTQIAPGTKVRFEKTASVQSGILLLESHSLCILGGRVQSLYEEWEMECKYSGLFRSTLKSTQIKASSGPPPFERIEIPEVQSLRKSQVLMQDAAVMKSGRNIRGTRTGQIIDNVGSSENGGITERVRVGYELYRPKVSERRPVENLKSSSESLDNTCLCSNVETKVLSGNPEQEGSAGDMISSELQTNNPLSESRKNETRAGQYNVVNHKTKLVTEAIPVQNQAAAQKLLNKMSGTGREAGGYKHDRFGRSSARYSGKGKREEAAILTLDEWEMQNGKMKAISSRSEDRSEDVSQDAEIARQLQTQLDLEAANVNMAHEEAEKIRMSMFNFRNMSDSSQNGSRKPRGRGRGKRQFN